MPEKAEAAEGRHTKLPARGTNNASSSVSRFRNAHRRFLMTARYFESHQSTKCTRESTRRLPCKHEADKEHGCKLQNTADEKWGGAGSWGGVPLRTSFTYTAQQDSRHTQTAAASVGLDNVGREH